MNILQVTGFIVALVARLVLVFAGIPFLVSSTAFCRLILDVMAMKFAHNSDLFYLSPNSSAKFNLYAAALFSAAVYLVAFAIYAIYVAIFSYKSGIKKLTFASSLTFTSALLIFMLATPSLYKLNKDSLSILKHSQSGYDWSTHDALSGSKINRNLPVAPVPGPNRGATLAWDMVQESLHCCGFRAPSDWTAYKPAEYFNQDVLPRTCCRDVNEADFRGDGQCRKDMARWTDNCSDKVHKVIQHVVNIIGMTIYFGMLFALLGCIVLICHPYDDTYDHSDTVNIYYGDVHPSAVNGRLISGSSSCNNCKNCMHNYGAPLSAGYGLNYGSY